MARRSITRKTFIKIISFIIFLITVLSIFSITGNAAAKKYKTELEYSYLRNLNELSSYISNIEVSLEKGIYANTKTQQQGLASKLMVQSAGAKTALEQLPNSSSENLININKFIAQVGDFSNYLSSKISKGENITEAELDNLRSLAEYAKTVNTAVKDLMANLDSNKDNISLLGEHKNDSNNNSSSVASSFKDLNNQFTSYPTLIYDGPFSDHILKMKSKFLEGKEEISKNDAIKKVSSFLGVNESDVRYISESSGNLPTYKFKIKDSYEVSVTKNGGYINYILKNKDVNEIKLSYKDAENIAKEFMSKNNINDMKESYYIIDNGICTINYAFTKENVIYYPDLIKISVALDTGEILNFNATGYLMNHTERSLPKNIIPLEKAKESVSKNLTIKNSSKSIIPTSGLNEVFCYAFECEGINKEKVLVYVNAQTALEEQIYVIITSDNGTLVM